MYSAIHAHTHAHTYIHTYIPDVPLLLSTGPPCMRIWANSFWSEEKEKEQAKYKGERGERYMHGEGKERRKEGG